MNAPPQQPVESVDADNPDREVSSYIGKGRYWDWLPTDNGAIRRSTVNSMRVQRIDGTFKNGAQYAWIVQVSHNFDPSVDPVSLRPMFFDSEALSEWVDKVFLGATFSLIPPPEVQDAIERESAAGEEFFRSLRSSHVSGAIRTVSDGMLSATPYEPVHGGAPDPKQGGPHIS